MKKCHALLAGALFAVVSMQLAIAQPAPADIGRQNDLIERQLQERLREQQERARESLTPRAPSGTPVPTPDLSVPDLGVPCRDIREIRVDGATLLPEAERAAIASEFAGRCLGVRELEAILARLTRHYIDRGYVTTRAYLPAQDLRTGTLRVQVVEGSIERFEVDSPRAGAQWPPGAFPAEPGDLLNLRDLEQGIDQLNRLASNDAQLDLRPGSRPGQSVVVVRNRARTPVRLFLTWDNLGTRATGRQSVSATLGLDSLLGLNELISLTHRESVPHDPEHQSRADAFAFSIPWGYTTFSFDLSESRYANLIAAVGGGLLSEGRTTSGGLTLDRVVYRDQASRLSLTGRLGVQDSRSWLAGQFLAVASRQQTTLDLAASGFTAALGGIFNARLGVTRGLPVLGGMDDPANLPDILPHARFTKANLDLGFNRRFRVADRPLLWSSQFSAQHAFDTLFGAQQIAIGGVSSVRGFVDNSLSGDHGLLWRNELALPFALEAGGGRVYVAHDIGRVRNRAPGVPEGTLSGITVGASLQYKAASLEAFASRALGLPAGMQREATRIGVRLSYSL